jgi:hypothetical protein
MREYYDLSSPLLAGLSWDLDHRQGPDPGPDVRQVGPRLPCHIGYEPRGSCQPLELGLSVLDGDTAADGEGATVAVGAPLGDVGESRVDQG